MTAVYASALALGVLALLAWILAHGIARNADDDSFDPERRWGVPGRRVVAAVFGFGMAGMSAEFAAREISALAVFGLAMLGAAASWWWAGQVLDDVESEQPAITKGGSPPLEAPDSEGPDAGVSDQRATD